MTGTLTNTVELVWDLTRERPTIGGALVLRQEGEILALLNDESTVTLHLVCQETDRAAAKRLASAVFASSTFSFRIIPSSTAAEGWPTAAIRAHAGFSYFSFSRLLTLHAETGLAPRLRWHAHPQALAQRARARFPGRLICVHPRSVAPFAAEESNAGGPTWDAFFAAHARPGSLDFLLIGDDPLPVSLTLRPGVSRAVDLGLDLATQLALVGCADGFLGLASGLCTAANLSETPHVIFKHPAHHPAEMARELGEADRFPFAGPRQRLWRRVVDAAALEEAFDLISP
jgi:hypothetical protein